MIQAGRAVMRHSRGRRTVPGRRPCPRRIVIDNFKAAVETADRYTPRFNKTFLEYANYRGFLPDAARPRRPKDKPVVENGVRYARERFWKGETFIDLDDVWHRSQRWCRDVAG